MAFKIFSAIRARFFSQVSDTALEVGVNDEAQARLKLDAGGRLTWGPGNVAGDTNLYRETDNVLKTDDAFKSASLYVNGVQVDPTGATLDNILVFDGSKFGSASVLPEATLPPIDLDLLSDVAITSVHDGQILEFDGSNWVNTVQPSGEPMGIEDRVASTISFNNATRTFTITPSDASFVVWCKGKRFVKTEPESVTIGASTGTHFIFYDSAGVLSSDLFFFDLENQTPVSYVYWNSSTGRAEFFADERHGVTLDWQTHEYLHRTRGAALAAGFNANNFVLDGNGSLDSHAQIGLTGGTFFDEDLEVNVVHSATPTVNTWEQILEGVAKIPVFYLSGTSWIKDTATNFPLKMGSVFPVYNLNTSGSWSTPDLVNNKFGTVWLAATNNLNEPVIAILGQNGSDNKSAAEALQWSDLVLPDFPILEFRPLYKIIFQVNATYTNSVKAAIRGVLDIRRQQGSVPGIPAQPVVHHGSLTGLVEDDHPQYLTSGRHNSLDHSGVMDSVVLTEISDVAISDPVSGEVLQWDGGGWVNAEVVLGTQTTGDYVQSIVGGTGVTVYGGSGESANASVSIGQDVGTGASVQFVKVDTSFLVVDSIEIDPSGAVEGNALVFDGSKFAPGAGGGGGATVTVSATAPESPDEGDLWFDSTNASTFVFYDSFWVEIGASGSLEPVLAVNDLTDVSAGVPNDGDVLMFNSSTGLWESGQPSKGVSLGLAIALGG